MSSPQMLSMSTRQINTPPIEFVTKLKAGEHGCIFYTSQEEMQKIHFAFIKSGLEDNWGTVYATYADSLEGLRNAMQKHGIDVKRYEDEGSLVLARGADLYKVPENPDLENCKSVVKSAMEGFMAKGKKGVRIAGDLANYFMPRALKMQWFELEHLFERQTSLPLTVLCSYDAFILPQGKDLDILFYFKKINQEWRDFVDAHSFAIYVSKNNRIIFTI
jgi:hypothetical protein